MIKEIFLMPLGGGQRVGASCYFLKIGDANIILDAGTGKENGLEFEPDFHSLVTTPFVQSMSQISQIYISHAHSDHIGYLMKLMKQAGYADVYMTGITKILAEYQLYDRVYCSGRNQDEEKRLAAKSLLEKVAVVHYMQSMDFGRYRVTFYPAGHIPGAMMTLFDTGRQKILYTGDYSLAPTLLTHGCFLPGDAAVDTLIMCGLHAKHPDYVKRPEALSGKARAVLKAAADNAEPILCYVPQLSKGIEFLKALDRWNDGSIPVYLDRSVMKMVEKMEKLSIPVMSRNMKIMGGAIPKEPHVYITSEKTGAWAGYYQEVRVDFSLHEDFSEMKKFIKAVNPRQALIVHCAKERDPFGMTIEQEMMKDTDCRTQFIFAEEKEIYKL